MSESLLVILASARGRLARDDFLRRPLVDDSKGRFVQTAGAFCLSAAFAVRTLIALAASISSRVAIGADCWAACLDL